MARAELEDDRERLPASPRFLAPRLAVMLFLIVITWQIWGVRPAAIVAAAAAALVAVFMPRALVIDRNGFQVVSFRPRKEVPWAGVESFGTGYTPRAGSYVSYTKVGRRPHWWYPAGWPAQGSIVPAFATEPGRRALSAAELCELLSSRLARARAQAGSL